MPSKRFVWYSDPHINLSVFPFLKRLYILRLEKEKADGLFITGDISTGRWLESDLRFLAKHYQKPIYFVLGNHDYYGRHIASVHADLRRICAEYSNLNWMTESGVVSLSDDIALVGTEGWYDAMHGDPGLLKYTLDRFLVFDFLHLDSMEERIELWRLMARRSASLIERNLEAALKTHSTAYVLTHVPPWKEATRAVGTSAEKFWLPYNTNVALGTAISGVASRHPDKRVVVLAGHTHTPCSIRVSDNLECHVARASYWGKIQKEQTLVL